MKPLRAPAKSMMDLVDHGIRSKLHLVRGCVVLICLAIWLSIADHTAAEHGAGSYRLPCKYSVRDVGFVNVHGQAWQLELLKPDLSAAQLAEINDAVRQQLDRSNISLLWLDPDSEAAAGLRDRDSSQEPSSHSLTGRLVSMAGESIPIRLNGPSDPGGYASLAESLVQSPARDSILAASARSLCVVVMIGGEDDEANRQAAEMVDEAVAKLERQMWMLEKPTERSPEKIIISRQDREREYWLLETLGIDKKSLPSVSIIFGQGRQLGDSLNGERLTADNIVGQASICGRDCECDLDRNWLYGRQFVHRWSLENERAAETTLDFDPHSGLVIAEVANIVRKTNARGQTPNAPELRMGQGLVIHDLEALEPATPETDSGASDPSTYVSPAESTTESDTIDQPRGADSADTVQVGSRESAPGSPLLPAWLIGGLLVIVLFVGVMIWKRNL